MAASVKLALRLIEDGSLAKAMPYLEGSGLGSLDLAEIRAQLKHKHPQDRRGWSPGSANRAPEIVFNHVQDTFKNLARNAGAGVGRFRNECMLRLVRREMPAAANSDQPPWFYTAQTTAVQFAPIKTEGGTPAAHDDVGCGGSGRALGEEGSAVQGLSACVT